MKIDERLYLYEQTLQEHERLGTALRELEPDVTAVGDAAGDKNRVGSAYRHLDKAIQSKLLDIEDRMHTIKRTLLLIINTDRS